MGVGVGNGEGGGDRDRGSASEASVCGFKDEVRGGNIALMSMLFVIGYIPIHSTSREGAHKGGHVGVELLAGMLPEMIASGRCGILI
jgi:hypothetical protein